MKTFSKLMVAICLITAIITQAQNYPQNYFRNPLNVPMQLAANFGAVRANHFHMGLDLRTNSQENLPVVAAADGYVSRIKVERYGFGNAVYITHPNGYTTVYAHLNKYFDKLDEYVKERQYKDEKWEQDITFQPEQFPVTKGQLIALSGNTGGSAGPHLHFEIRDTKTEECINPLFLDLIFRIMLLRLSADSIGTTEDSVPISLEQTELPLKRQEILIPLMLSGSILP